ncbi:AMP-binding protein [Euzebya sp.]|uniref:AMP-binding protein n=1 Tax=Euzebya sp. TaxID=1971409 RepID=UPI0035162D61
MFGLPPLSARDVTAGLAGLARAGVIRPLLPTPSLVGLLLELPLVRPNLGLAVAYQAHTQPDAVAIIDEGGMVTWGELDRRVTRLANVLGDHSEPGGVVAFLLRNGREAVECYAAGGRAGLAPAPLNTWSTASEIARILHMQRPAVLVCDAEFRAVAERALRLLDDPPVLLGVGPDGEYEQALAAASTSAPFARGTSKVVIHTSGTTGAPKGAERTVGLSQAGALLGFVAKVPLRRGHRVMVLPPLFHAFGSGMAAAACLIGATLVLPRTVDPATFERDVRVHDVTAAVMVPIMVRQVLDHPEPASPSPLRIVLTSGSALAASLRDEAQRRWGEIVYDLYGSTEAGWVAISTPTDFRERRGTVGRPGPGMRVEVLDEHGERLGPGEVGALHVSTGMEFSGYTGADGHRGAWDIGDLGFVDADGYLYVTGRRDEMIISGGENIYPSEVEEAIAGHPAVVEAAVIGMDDETYGQVLWAYVAGDVEPEELRTWLRERLSRVKVPKRVVVVDALPRTATGKVLKRQLVQSEHPSRG